MYESFFQLRSRAFPSAPTSERFFTSAGMHAARATLDRIVERGEGPGVIIGPSGIGKTLLCQRLAADFSERLSVALLSSGRICTRRALLQAILYELRLPYRGMEEGELRLTLIDHIAPVAADRPGLLLLVDEAHTLPWRLLEELRMITNLVKGGQPRACVVLAGGPLLEERLASPKLDSFSQRVAARCYLGPLSRDETALFVRHQIGLSGGEPDRVFEASAYDAIHAATGGVPRLVNQLCDHALVLAQLAGVRPVGAAVIEEAWSDLQQLPNPWHTSAPAAEAGGVIEFAALDDGPEAIPFRSPVTPIEAGEPEANLDQIERRLQELEDDFQPAGSIGPEIELRFDRPASPFEESYEEEEIVIDRYASYDADVFTDRPLVNSPDGLGDELNPWLVQAAETTVSIAAGMGMNPTVVSLPKDPAADCKAAKTAGETKTYIAAQSGTAGGDSDNDADLIIIEDDPADSLPKRPTPLVRRQEYRQLFAKLRHG